MQKVLVGLSSSLAIVGAVFGIWATSIPDKLVDRELQVVGGRTAVGFFTSALESNGLSIKVQQTAEGEPSGDASFGFIIDRSDLTFQLADAKLTQYGDGQVVHTGGFKITSKRGALDATGFAIRPSTVTNNGLAVTVKRGNDTIVAFELTSPKTGFDIEVQRLVVRAMDMNLTLQAAQQLGRPDLAGMLVGTLSIYGDSKPIDGGGEVTGPNNGGRDIMPASADIDVAISNLEALTVLGRVGTFPNGRNGLSMRTTSCNVGLLNIPWAAPMNEAHPVIAMNLYRVMNGRFEQVGWSWLKHGFFATNSPGCGNCIHPGTGSLLGPGCSDTYGTGNNGDRFYLGERKEVNPFIGEWECTGSWFSNYVADCTRRNTGSGLDPVAHRLDVLDADLGNAGAIYYYEAYYINKNDFDRYNNISSRSASFSWSGSAWIASTTDGSQLQGPAIYRYGDMQQIAEPRTEGDVIVAVKVTDNGNGTWHYEYVVYNHDLDRQVDEFSVPLPFGATVTSVGFRDIDQNGGNQWTPVVSGSAIEWTTDSNPLTYSSVFNFRFDANVQPASTTTTLGLFKPGVATSLTAATRGPLVFQQVASFQTMFSNLVSGNLQSLKDSDNDRVNLTMGLTISSNSGMGIQTSITAPLGAINSFIVGVESSDSTGPGSGGTREILLWDWTTAAWVVVDSRATTTQDSTLTVLISTNPGRFVNASTREVRARFMHKGGLALSSQRPIAFDQVGFHFN